MNLYVYGFVLLDGAPDRPMTIAGRRLEILSIAGLNVAVERLPAPPTVSEAALRLQHTIVDRLGRTFGAIVPARFGSFVPVEELQQIVRLRRAALRKTLHKFRGRVQMTVRIVTPLRADSVSTAGASTNSGTAYLNARRAALSSPRPPLAAAVSDAVRALAHDERIQADGNPGRTALFHLIDRGDAKRYRAAVQSVPIPAGESVTMTGPYAPFAFAPELWP
jgi:hypothetical protein